MSLGLAFRVETAQVGRLARSLAAIHGQHEQITARAMIRATRASKEAVRQKIFPLIQGGPTRWTERGLIGIYGNRQSAIGFNYGDGSLSDLGFTSKGIGVPSGRYMGVNARGGPRDDKSTEVSLKRFGKIWGDRYIVPAPDSDANKFDKHGNISGSEYKKMLSRVRASEFGSAPKGKGSRGRSGKKRAQDDYFIMKKGGVPTYIAKRSGYGPMGGTGKGSNKPGRPMSVGYKRGFDVAFFITKRPQYKRRFPIQSVAWREYQRVFPLEYQKALMRLVK